MFGLRGLGYMWLSGDEHQVKFISFFVSDTNISRTKYIDQDLMKYNNNNVNLLDEFVHQKHIQIMKYNKNINNIIWRIYWMNYWMNLCIKSTHK